VFRIKVYSEESIDLIENFNTPQKMEQLNTYEFKYSNGKLIKKIRGLKITDYLSSNKEYQGYDSIAIITYNKKVTQFPLNEIIDLSPPPIVIFGDQFKVKLGEKLTIQSDEDLDIDLGLVQQSFEALVKERYILPLNPKDSGKHKEFFRPVSLIYPNTQDTDSWIYDIKEIRLKKKSD
jgi:uncharacterized protein YegL